MTIPILYDYWRSSASYRVRIALAMKGIDYRRVAVDPAAGGQKKDAHRARNPQSFVPVLEIDGQRLTQSLAIIGYLDATRPEPRLLPADSAAAAHVQTLALTVACDIHPLNNLCVLQYIEDYLSADIGIAGMNKSAWIRTWIAQGFAALEALAAPGAGRFLFGDAPGLADICLVPQMYNARRFGVPLDDYPLLVRADAEACALPAFAAAHPDAIAAAQQ